MKLIGFIFFLFLYSCQHKPKDNFKRSPENGDTPATKEMLERELEESRASIKDPYFKSILDANLEIQSLKFILQDGSTPDTGLNYFNKLVAADSNGVRLYTIMKEAYNQAMKFAMRAADRDFYAGQIEMPIAQWLSNKFPAKTKIEYMVSLILLQKECLLISMINSKVDSDAKRKEMEEEYNEHVNLIRSFNL